MSFQTFFFPLQMCNIKYIQSSCIGLEKNGIEKNFENLERFCLKL